MSVLEASINNLNELIKKGESILAMELFYADNVTMQENQEEPRRGKQVCIAHEIKNRERVIALESQLLNQAIDKKNNVVFSEWRITVYPSTVPRIVKCMQPV